MRPGTAVVMVWAWPLCIKQSVARRVEILFIEILRG
jgi:hypothetical protein